jgi:hypothetical protein
MIRSVLCKEHDNVMVNATAVTIERNGLMSSVIAIMMTSELMGWECIGVPSHVT